MGFKGVHPPHKPRPGARFQERKRRPVNRPPLPVREGRGRQKGSEKLPKHRLQDTAVAVRLQLHGRVDAGNGLEADLGTILPPGPDGEGGARGELGDSLDVVHLRAVQPQAFPVLARPELEGEDRPSRSGCCGGSARSSPRSPPARPSRYGPWPPSPGRSRSRTPCPPGPAGGRLPSGRQGGVVDRSSPRRRAGGGSSRPRSPARAGSGAGCWRRCPASSPRGCPGGSRRC